jgi:signal peptidase I
MKRKHSLLNTFFAAITLVLMAVAWLLFVPTQFGGQASYVVIAGNSMEPLFHQGDLVILRRATAYQVGDIVTYRHPEIGPVIHRIVAQEGNRYIFKGDHNTWDDAYRPTQSDFMGKFWLHLPSVGRLIEPLRTPWAMALLASGSAVIVLLSATSRQSRPKDRQHGRKPAKEQHRPMSYLHQSKTDLFFVLATLAVASVLLAFFAFTQPISQTVTDQISYEQRGEFSYSAAAPPGIYEADKVQTGEPIFRQLITKVQMNFDYHFATSRPSELQGTYRVVARISHSNGWRWTLELQPMTAFNGNSFRASNLLDLSEVQALITNVEQQTGLQRQQYTLDLVPEVTIKGQVAEQAVYDQFAPCLTFQLDDLQMRLAQDISPVSDTQNPLKPTQTGLVSRTREMPNVLSLLNFQLKVSSARQLALVGLVLSLGGILALGWSMHRATQGSEATRIHLKYHPLLVTIYDPDLEMGQRMIRVATMDDLARIAERDGRMILHQTAGPIDRYLVPDSVATYYYQPSEVDRKTSLPLEEAAQ